MSFPLETIRHSASHVLAQAVLVLFPDAKLAIGPAIDDGFYYDFDLPRTLTDDDLKRIEKEMKRIIKEKQPFFQFELSKEDAEKKLNESDQPYKIELINDLGNESYSFFENGPFVDLCRGPHVNNTREIGHVKLLRVSGAYWRGDESRKMLQRIYGTAFPDKTALHNYLKQLEEAKKRDHRVLGRELDLFSIQDEVGAGLILWHPKGSMIRHIIESYWKDQHFKNGYQLLHTPHVGKSNLWDTSGHLDFYKDTMFSSLDIENQSYYMRPMNCPFHIMVYNKKRHSYRDLPLRYAELGTVYRFERSGVLHGLMRVRGFTQDDAHIFCTEDTITDEIQNVLKFCLDVLKKFGFDDFELFVSTRPEEKYVGDLDKWTKAESALEDAVKQSGLEYQIDEGGGAFYGPKIDIKIKDAIGRKWQCSTIQFDFNLPERFELSYTGSDGNLHQPFMVHRALFGSIERFFGVLIEHYAGKFPAWLAPVQVKILAVNDSVHDYCRQVHDALTQRGIRSELDISNEKLGYKIRSGQVEKVPYMAVIGKQELDSNVLAIRSRDEGDLGALSVDALCEKIESEFN